MKLQNLSDAELGRIVRQSPLWNILLKMEERKIPDCKSGQEEKHQVCMGGTYGTTLSSK